MEQLGCLTAASLVWIGKSPLSIVQKTIFTTSSLFCGYAMTIDKKLGHSTAIAFTGIYLLQTGLLHIGSIGYGLQGLMSGYHSYKLYKDDFEDEM